MQRIFFLLLLFLTHTHVSAQFYIGVRAGVAAPWAPHTFSDASLKDNGQTKTKTVFATSLGKGLLYGLDFSWAFSEKCEVAVGTYYLNGRAKQEFRKDPESTATNYYELQMLRLTPSIRTKWGQKSTKVVGIFGLGLGLGGSISYLTKSESNNGDTYISKWIYKGGTAYQIVGGLGLEHQKKPASKYRFFAEIKLLSGAYSPRRSDWKEASKNGVSLPPPQTLRERQTIYVKTVSTNTPDPNKPNIDLRQYFPLGSVGLELGMWYRLW